MIRITGKPTPLSEAARPILEQLNTRMLELGMNPKLGIDASSDKHITIHIGMLVNYTYIGTWQIVGNNPSTPDLMPGIIELKIRRMVESLFFDSTSTKQD